jgi:hypothetical protein
VDIVLEYPKFLKIWYKKKKITLQDVSLSKKDGPMVAIKEVIVEFEVESKVESNEGDKTKPRERHNNEAKEVIDSKAQCVTNLKKKKNRFLQLLYIIIHII